MVGILRWMGLAALLLLISGCTSFNWNHFISKSLENICEETPNCTVVQPDEDHWSTS